MAWVRKGTFLTPLSTGTFPVAGVGKKGKAVILFSTSQADAGYSAGNRICVGMADVNLNEGCNAVAADNGIAASNTGRYIASNRCLIMPSSGTPSLSHSAHIVSFDDDGFTLYFDDADASRLIVHYIVIGGKDIDNVKVFQWNDPAASGQNSIGGVGFQPDFLFIIHDNSSTESGTGLNFNLGATDGTTQVCTSIKNTDNVNPTQAAQLQHQDACISAIATGSDAINGYARFVSFNADGFTLDWTAILSGITYTTLALKGGSTAVLVDTQATTIGTKSKSGMGFRPNGLFMFGWNHMNWDQLETTEALLSIGAADDIGNEGCIWVGSGDNVSPTIENSSTVLNKIFKHSTPPSTTDAEADLYSLDADGYTLYWSTVNPETHEFNVIGFGGTTFEEDPYIKTGAGIIG